VRALEAKAARATAEAQALLGKDRAYAAARSRQHAAEAAAEVARDAVRVAEEDVVGARAATRDARLVASSFSLGLSIDAANPPASVFRNAAGFVGYKIFGVVMWSAAITSVVGAAYTSVSFFKSFSSSLEQRSNYIIVAFIVVSTLIFLTVGRPVVVLVWAGTVNGFILPIGLALVLLASRRSNLVKGYSHPAWLQIAGWAVVAIMTGFSIQTLIDASR
jgi:Mn2+/Fe2+ NRAMP family transporter